MITCDGRLIQGTLVGYDQLQNLIMKNAQERVYQFPQEQETDDNENDNEEIFELIPLGLYLIRGDNVAVMSDLREGVLEGQDKSRFDGFENGESIKPVVQGLF